MSRGGGGGANGRFHIEKLDPSVFWARAESEAQIIRAEAEKQSLILKGTGEAERARLLNETPLGNSFFFPCVDKNCFFFESFLFRLLFFF